VISLPAPGVCEWLSRRRSSHADRYRYGKLRKDRPFAWVVSAALGEPVAAVVPGSTLSKPNQPPSACGTRSVGPSMHSKAQPGSFTQTTRRPLPMMGRDLAHSMPGRETAPTGAPVFRHGSAASDDVNAICEMLREFTSPAPAASVDTSMKIPRRSLPWASVHSSLTAPTMPKSRIPKWPTTYQFLLASAALVVKHSTLQRFCETTPNTVGKPSFCEASINNHGPDLPPMTSLMVCSRPHQFRPWWKSTERQELSEWQGKKRRRDEKKIAFKP